eukprot:TRINITY_DN1645_c1_g3_i2.p2 TRINITY_DN1645_c1_g3~~TRINITY_DN1645_c1_g3_i2.p2  ORF type:complete len:145 (+),score=50.67 TRINITY_DN1645_c1_g3_i2:313-747(+)
MVFSQMNRELLWDAFTDFLTVMIPLLQSGVARATWEYAAAKWASLAPATTLTHKRPPPPPPPPRGAGAAADEAEMEAAGRCCYCGEGAVVACVAGACGHVCCYYCVGSAIKSNRRECPRCGGPLFESPTRWAPPSAAPTSLPTV